MERNFRHHAREMVALFRVLVRQEPAVEHWRIGREAAEAYLGLAKSPCPAAGALQALVDLAEAHEDSAPQWADLAAGIYALSQKANAAED